MSEKKYYVCEVCGNIVEKIHDSGTELMCCMRPMSELEAGETDGKLEYHVPVCSLKEKTLEVRIGEKPHPMEAQHYIQWIEVRTNKGIMRKFLHPDDKPVAYFHLCDDEKVCAIFAYCNLHKLWKE